jgi:DNA-directed RNA polymerase specialized sigma24 family protein
MPLESSDHRLSRISTMWSLVQRAHEGTDAAAAWARGQLLECYCAAVRRYLRRVLRDPHAADEVFQEFALRLLHGDLRGADPHRGRFRDFVKGTLLHLVANYRKRQQRWPARLPSDDVPSVAESADREFDGAFADSWRDELLARAWTALAEADGRAGQLLFAVLRFRADHPEMRSPQMAVHFAGRFGRSFTAAGIRQILHRARERFAEFVLVEVRRALEKPTTEAIEQELADLNLLDYCRPVLARHVLRM